MNIPTLTQAAKGAAVFLRYCGYPDPTLWYRLLFITDGGEDSFDFPIPVKDSGAGTFDPEMRGINVLRWVRKHSDVLSGRPPEPPPVVPDGGCTSR